VSDIRRLQLSFPADRQYIGLVGAVVRELCGLIPNLPASAGYNVQLAVDEAVVNVITHAYAGNPDGVVQMEFAIWPDRLVIQVRDWGLSFDPSSIPEPNFDRPQQRGYGMYLMRRLMDQVIYEEGTAEGNCVTLIKMTG